MVWPSMSRHGDDVRAVPSRMTERVEGATFAEQTVQLDGRRFVSCSFDGCSIVYAGGPAEVLACTFTDCVWRLEGRAANTVTLLGGLGASDGSTGQRLVDSLFSQLRRRGDDVATIPAQASTPERLGVHAVDEVRFGDVTITTSADATRRAEPRAASRAEATRAEATRTEERRTDGTREHVASASAEAPNGEARRRAPSGRWIFLSGDVAWILIAAGVVLVTVVLGRTGG